MTRRQKALDRLRLLRHSLRTLAGRRWWLLSLPPIAWPAFLAFQLLVGWRQESFDVEAAQSIMQFPLVILAIAIGVRVIAGECEARTVEMVYTVPGGAWRIWLSRLAAATVVLLLAELLLIPATWFLAPVAPSALIGAFQSSFFFLSIGMGFGALTRSEITGAMLSTVVLFLSTFLGAKPQLSPFFNPLTSDLDPHTILAMTVQNRIGYLILIAAIILLACSRAERREKMLG